MEILGLVGSPRKRSNTDLLVDAVLDEAQQNGHRSSKIYLYDLAIGPCIDCRGCKKDDMRCIVDDDMQQIYDEIEAADAIVFGTPVYWLGPTGPMKMLIDRLRPYYSNGRMKGKKAVIVAPAGDGPKEADLLVEMLRRSFAYLELDLVGTVLGTAYEREEILQDGRAMAAAGALGARL